MGVNGINSLNLKKKHRISSLEGGNGGDEKVQVEFGREALYEFYGQLEVIQKQIDALNG